MTAVTCFVTPVCLLPPPPTGVDLSNIVKTAPKVSADGPQEPTHDILQVGMGIPHSRSCVTSVWGHLFPVSWMAECRL